MKTDSSLDHIAAFAANLRLADLPAAVVDKARDCVLDALSACLTAGATLEGTCAAVIGAGPRGEGEATLIGIGSIDQKLAKKRWYFVMFFHVLGFC